MSSCPDDAGASSLFCSIFRILKIFVYGMTVYADKLQGVVAEGGYLQALCS